MFTQNHDNILEENPAITNHSEAQLPAMGSRHHEVGGQEVSEPCGMHNHGLGFIEAGVGGEG